MAILSWRPSPTFDRLADNGAFLRQDNASLSQILHKAKTFLITLIYLNISPIVEV
jgi:hypothetical protein